VTFLAIHLELILWSLEVAMDWLYVTVEPAHQQVVVRPCGEIDIATAEYLRLALDAALQQERVSRLEVDMSGVSFMDCSGLRVLVAIKERLHQQGGMLVLTNAVPRVDRLLSIVGLDHQLDPRLRGDRRRDHAHRQPRVSCGSRSGTPPP
jgi:anti-anti-sigma factor